MRILKKSLLQLKINQMYELLLINQKIVDEDLKKIFSCLNGIDQNLFELANSRIDNFNDLDATRAITNPLAKDIEILVSIIKQYDKY